MPDRPVTIIGSYLSPYVRKALVCLDLKGIDYRIDPIVPFFGNERFAELSPVRRIPVLIDGAVTLADSTVICEYLDEAYPDPPLHPRSAADRARARWLEEYADTRMGEVFIWRLFNEIVIRRAVWGERSDDSVLRHAVDVEVPEVLDYLEGQLEPDRAFLFDEIGIADISLAVFFRNAEFTRYAVDPGRWPRVSAFVRRTLDHPSFRKLRRFEDLLLKTPIERHREVLAEAGAPLTSETLATATPRRGVLHT